MKKILFFLSFIILMTQLVWGATYTWNGANNASWATPASWNPNRTTPATGDTLLFSSGTTLTITAVPTQTIGRFVMSNNTNITLQSSSTQTLTIGNVTGTDLDIPSGSSLTIGTNANITLASSATANIAGSLIVNSGRTYNTDGTSVVTTVTGAIVDTGTVTCATTSKLLFQSGSTYEHAANGGDVPTATWDVNSTCLVTGVVGTMPTGFDSSATSSNKFGNLTWNCPDQNFTSPTAITGPIKVNGNLTIMSTGSATNSSAQFRVSTGDIIVNGNFIMTKSAGSNSTLVVSGQSSKNLVVKGNVNIASGDSLILNLFGYSANGWLYVAGNLTNAGVITQSGTSTASGILFNGIGTQTYTSSGTIHGVVNDSVKSGSTLQMADASTVVSGGGRFTLSSGATLGITSSDGITSSAATGNIQVTGTRTFSTGANYIYNGTGPQATGTGLPTNLTGVLTINNPGNTVTLDNARTIASGGTVNIVAGTFAAGTNLTMASTSSITRSGGTMTGTPQSTGVYNVTYTGNSMTTTTELSGSGMNNVTVNLTAGQTLTLDANRTPDGNLTITAGTFDLSTFTINRSGAGGTLTVSNGTTLRIGSTNTLPSSYSAHSIGSTSTIEYYGSAQSVATLNSSQHYGNLTLSGSGSKTILSITVDGILTMAGTATASAAPTYGAASSLLYAGSASQTTGAELLATMARPVTINNSNGVILGGVTTLNGTLTFTAGKLTLGTNKLTLGSAATVGGASSSQYIVTDGAGMLAVTYAGLGTKSFPVGKSQYNPASITADAATIVNVSVQDAFKDGIPDATYAVDVQWTTSQSGTANLTYAFTWNSAQAGSNFTPGSSAGWQDVSTVWTNVIPGTTTGTTFTALNPTTLVGVFLVGNDGALPVEMTSFTAVAQKTNTQLKWSTATEVNNYGFEIERRAIASSTWAKIGFVSGAGTSNSKHNYTYADNNLSAGNYAYRIKQIDNDGAYKYSASTEVTIVGVPKELKLYGNYPNPFNPSTKVQFTVPENGNVRLRVYNVIGQEVATLFNGAAEAGNLYTANFDGSRMSSGLYFSVLEFGNQRITHKMMMTK